MADTYFLADYPIYRDFDADDIETLGKICEEKKYLNGQDIFREGDAGDGLYIIKKGAVKIVKENKSRKKLIATLAEGEFFGEMSIIDGSPRSATVESSGNVELVKLTRDGFEKLKDEYSRTGFKFVGVLLKFMSYRIRRTTKKAATLMKGRKKKRK
jgi:CRP/FNR family transcriptional regulator/CRP/FNR family cyclic AMP-dependent transcriptional regulator